MTTNTKTKIKVIKKGEPKAVEKKVVVERATAKNQVREMVGTVTNWVSEFQHRKSEETKVAFEHLFAAKQPQTSGA
ncbi:MAG: hypothetical protein IPN69_11770 [Acidobacteria bacterium]|nr:hypothetical protein [Acidobacteriota bacterium]MBK8150396.1 hypothetical protein [Acidobacteriota bacterium]MBK8811393.1 hypothetical protein [Acidobacteriota bacterium]